MSRMSREEALDLALGKLHDAAEKVAVAWDVWRDSHPADLPEELDEVADAVGQLADELERLDSVSI